MCMPTLMTMLTMCDIDCLRAISVTVRIGAECAKKELLKRAKCCLTHATDLRRWDFGFTRLYKHRTTGEYANRPKGVPANNNEWRPVPVMAVQCRCCEDLHYLERDGTSWFAQGFIHREGMMRRSVLDRFKVKHPGKMMLPAIIDAVADGPMHPVLP